MFVGNGGNAGICSHMGTDYWNRGAIRSMSFESSLKRIGGLKVDASTG